MVRLATRRAASAAIFAVFASACSGPDPLEPKVPNEDEAAETEDGGAAPADDGSVVLVSAGETPRRVHGYAPTAKTATVVKTELAYYQPIARYRTSYEPVAREGAVTLLKATLTLDLADTMLSIVGPFLHSQLGSCSAEIRIDGRGALVRGGPEGGCLSYDTALYGMRPTSLRPGIRFPTRAIGVGARWEVVSPEEHPATYVLIDAEQGIATVYGEIEGPISVAGGPPILRPPKSAWMLARISPGEILTTATLAWPPAPPPESIPLPSTKLLAAPTALTRVNSVSTSAGKPRDGIRRALARAFGSADPSVREAAVGASGIANDWWSIESLLAMRERDPASQPAVDRALGLLTGRGARDLEDFIEASAPYACDGDARRADAILSSGLALGGTPTERARLLVFRGEIRRLLGDARGAREDFTEAFRLFPDDEDVALSVAWWLLTSPNAGDRDPKRALEIARSVANKPAMELSEQAQAAAHAELGNFAQAEEMQRQVAARLGGKWRFVSVEASDNRRITAARARVEAYRQKQRWFGGLIRDELSPCYRYFGLSHTLL